MGYAQSAYGPDPKLPWLENSDHGWGPYKWPGGVPADLLDSFTSEDGTTFVMRRELVPLAETLCRISERHYGYKLHNADGSGGYSGAYDNRPIGGTSTASAHSRARAIDTRAQDNPQSWTFQCAIPPEVVRMWEAHGFYWGGRYVGAKIDTMHFSYVRTPAEVASDLASARHLAETLGVTGSGGSAPTPQPAPAVELGSITVDGVSVEDVQRALNAAGARLAVDGDLGVLTTQAIRAYQLANGLAVDGVVGPATWARLRPNVGSPFPLPQGQVFGPVTAPAWQHGGDPRYDSPAIRDHIRRIQRRLIETGCVPGVSDPGSRWADGIYEDPTTAAVRRYQSAKGLAVDGLVGPLTWKAMGL